MARKFDPPSLIFTAAFTQARERKEMTVADVATAADVDKVTIYRALGSNGGTLRVSSMEAICKAVDLDPRRCWAKPAAADSPTAEPEQPDDTTTAD